MSETIAFNIAAIREQVKKKRLEAEGRDVSERKVVPEYPQTAKKPKSFTKSGITVKPTVYNGYNFRSRVEARWAVFFDEVGIRYYYEHQDYVICGRRYLPDFFLPDFDIHVEVKGIATPDDYALCCVFSSIVGQIVMLEGPPSFSPFNYCSGGEHYCGGWFFPEENRIWIAAAPGDPEDFHGDAIIKARGVTFEHYQSK